MTIKGIHKVKVKGSTYHYAWRGGPRLHLSPGDPGFEAEYEAICRHERRQVRPRVPTKPRHKPTLHRAARVALDNASRRAQRRGMAFTLTEQDIFDRLEKTGGCCELSGIPFDMEYGSSQDYAFNPYGMSIDRIRASAGYTPDNIRLTLTAVNFAIHQWGLDTYLRISRAVVARTVLG